LRAEDDAGEMALAIEKTQVRRISSANFVETAVVVDASRDPVASRRFDELVEVAELRVGAVTADQARIARDAYRDFGKGSGHKAGLNFGDCFAYALAKATGEALLFTGDNFGHTDITPVLPSAGRPDPLTNAPGQTSRRTSAPRSAADEPPLAHAPGFRRTEQIPMIGVLASHGVSTVTATDSVMRSGSDYAL
jgi:ribonuclease VapC